MFKNRITNNFSDKLTPNNQLALHSLLKNYLETSPIPKFYKEIYKSNNNIDNID